MTNSGTADCNGIIPVSSCPLLLLRDLQSLWKTVWKIINKIIINKETEAIIARISANNGKTSFIVKTVNQSSENLGSSILLSDTNNLILGWAG